MTNPEELIQLFKSTQWVINKQTDGLTHADSMLQLPFWDNCLNWVLGHIVHYRDRALLLLDEQPSIETAEIRLYQRESEPLSDADVAIPLSELLVALKVSQERLTTALAVVAPEHLEIIHDEERGQTIGDRLAFIQWHETYHVGQLEILRQLAGTHDSII